MKKFKRMLAGLACVLAVCLCTPTAFAAKVIIYFDANGGTCTSAAERTNDEGKLGSLPGASMEGYTFDGWYTTGTDDVTGFPIDVQVKANDTAFGADTTVYAHWRQCGSGGGKRGRPGHPSYNDGAGGRKRRSGAAGKPGTLRGADMQQNLKFPAQCTVIPAEELEQVSGGAPAWVGELKDQIRPYWQKAKPYLAFGIECGKAFVQVIAAAYSIYIYGRIIQDSMHGIKDSLNWFKGLN